MLGKLRDVGAALSRFTERWVPDAWVILMILTTVVLGLTIFVAGTGVEEALLAWGDGLWTLLAIAMQFSIALVAAHACVASRPIYRMLERLARLPDPRKPAQAVLLAGLFSMISGYLNWAVCLVGSALFVPFILKCNPKADIRLVIAAAYMGLGTTWQSGLSSSAPLILATPGNPLLAPGTGAPIVDRLYPATETLFNPFNLVYLLIIGAVGLLVAVALHPQRDVETLAPNELDAIMPKLPELEHGAPTPAGRIDAFRGWVLLAVILLAYPLGHSIVTRGFGASWTINAYNTVFLVVALLLHGRPLSFLAACRNGVDATWGIILQFPFYAGIFGLMQNTDLGAWLGEWFTKIATERTFPFVVYVYSGIMNLFVPSAGSKWLIEAPYLIPAGDALGVSTVTVTLAYMYGDSATNLIQPFWALPILAVTGRRFGDIVGYTLVITVACFLVSTLAMFLIPTRW